jgi:Predicted Fe-S oxidoreductases
MNQYLLNANSMDLLPDSVSDYIEINNGYVYCKNIKHPLCTTHLDITSDCNFNCPFCIEETNAHPPTYLTLTAVNRILNDISILGCKDLRLYGGEPTIHPNICQIINIAKLKGFKIRLVTNGSRLGDKELEKEIIDESVCLRVSLTGFSSDLHQYIYGCDSYYFSKIRENLCNLIQKGARVSINYLVNNSTVIDLEKSCSFWETIGAESFSLRMMTNVHSQVPLEIINHENRIKILRLIRKV